jgi:membrane glycosyltransferase
MASARSLSDHGVAATGREAVGRVRLVGRGKTGRRLAFFTAVAIATVAGSALMTDVLSGDGLTATEASIVTLFTINFSWIAISFMTGLVGASLRLLGRDPISLSAIAQPVRGRAPTTRTVVVMPIYNEDTARVFAGLRATWESVAATGHLAAFDFFVLSDTRDPDIWVEEELAWADHCRALGARGRLFYRRREHNEEGKPGNLMDFCRKWAGHYDHMIVLDADSVMAGTALVDLVLMMEDNPRAGLIQSAPAPTGRRTLFARVLQFMSRVHGPTMATGLAFWQLEDGNYWGHNAIIRTQAFIECCGLPILSGRPPLGGSLLSHDFVEAALLRRAGWQVWLVPQIEGSWEDIPGDPIAYAVRDRRWCQGNLQHIRVLPGSGLKPISRLHLFMGVMSYLSSPLWFALLAMSSIAAFEQARTAHAFFPSGQSLFPSWPVDRSLDMVVLLLVTLGMLVVPKLLSCAVLSLERDRATAFGGRTRLWAGAIAEFVYSVLLAPVMMVLHTRFVATILMGRAVSWLPQRRDDSEIGWGDAMRFHGGITALGLAWAGVAWWISPSFLIWISPVVAGLILSMPVARISSMTEAGEMARRRGLFLTPEEVSPPQELARLDELLQAAPATRGGIMRLFSDPHASALHGALLPTGAPTQRISIEVSLIYEKARRLGPDTLTREEKAKLLSWPVRPLDQIHGPARPGSATASGRLDCAP